MAQITALHSIQISVPAKIVLLGEWAVLDGFAALAATRSARFTTSLKTAPQSNTYRFVSKTPESGLSEFSFQLPSDHVSVPSYWTKAFQTFCALHKQNSWPTGLAFEFDREWTLTEGFGSSSALFICLWALNKLFGQKHDVNELSENLHKSFLDIKELMHQVEGGRGSGIDIATQLKGGCIVFQQNPTTTSSGIKIETFKSDIPPELLVLHTGRKTKTQDALKSMSVGANERAKIGESVERFLETHDWEKAIVEHNAILRQTPALPAWIQDIQSELTTKQLITTLKTSGAGGGDALLLWSKSNALPGLKEWASRNGFWLSTNTWDTRGLEISS